MAQKFLYPPESTPSRLVIPYMALIVWSFVFLPTPSIIDGVKALSNGILPIPVIIDILFISFCLILGSLVVNYQPVFWMTSDGLQIVWDLFRRIPVKPEHILVIHQNLEAKDFVFVECTDLPWYSGFYGLIHLHRFARGFLIGRDIQGFNQLLGILQHNQNG